MKNFVFISPNFPTNYWQFCHHLKENGLRVLGVGDQPYDELLPELKASLTEYYKVGSMENYDEVYRAVAFFISKYGRIDWLESNNEYWLERDAMLRTDFHITSGFQVEDMERIKYKSKMKPYYEAVGIKTARYHIVDDFDGCKAFIDLVGWPVIVKPDNGVGASHTYKLKNDDDLRAFLAERESWVSYIMEEFITAEVTSYDAIIDSKGEPVFESGNVTCDSLMDVVNEAKDSIFYIVKELPEVMKQLGRRTVKAFGVKSRFVHFEYFVLKADQEGLGKKGDIFGLEVNMRPPGGYAPELANFANSVDVYKIWADMIAYDSTLVPMNGQHYFCGFCGRRDGKNYKMSHDDIMREYGHKMKLAARTPAALSGAMADMMYVANYDTEEEMMNAFQKMCETW